MRKTILQGVENFNQITHRNNEILYNLIQSNAIDGSITTTIANLINSSKKSHFSLTHFKGIRFSINKPNPQNVIIKRSTLTFDNGSMYDLNNYGLSYFSSNTKFEKFNFTEKVLIVNFCTHLDFDTNHGDKKKMGVN